MPQPEVRVVGSGFTTLKYDGQDIAWLESFVDSGQTPGNGPSGRTHEAIYELGPMRHPKEIVTSYVVGEGSIRASIRETWNSQVWEHLSGLAGTAGILDVYEVLRNNPNRVQCQSIVTTPAGTVRGKVYHNCVVTSIPDGDSVTIGAMSVVKDISIIYTHSTPLNA